MQYQKDDIRERILRAAMEEFEAKGYRSAGISNIARRAGVPVGNLYRYFRSKQQLFDALMTDVTENLPRVIQEIYDRDIQYDRGVKEIAGNIADGILHIYNRYGRQLLLLADKSGGTKYEDFLPTLIEQITGLFRSGLFKSATAEDGIMADIIARGFVDGLFTVLRHADRASMERLLTRLLLFYFYKIEDRT